MGNVWEALKKHQADAKAEQAEQVEQAEKAKKVGKVKKTPEGPQASGVIENGPPSVFAPQPVVTPTRRGSASGGQILTPVDRKYAETCVAHYDRGSGITEEYRALRTSLLARCPDGKACFLVTSAEAGEGKSVTSANLALVLTERVARQTVLVDCDLRRGKLAKAFDCESAPGLAELMMGTATLAEVIQPTSYSNLFFIPTGNVKAAEAGEIIGRPEKAEIINELRSKYDHVIFDTPPINIVSDAGTIGRVVGQALLVVRMCKTRRESIDKAVRLLHAADVSLTGIVLTHRKYYIPNYLYRYS